MIVHEQVSVVENKPLSPRHFRLSFTSPAIASAAKPGQFVHLRFPETYHPLLRRPFSVEKISKGDAIDLIYDVVGIATERLAKLSAGDTIDVLGPLGKTFTVQPTTRTAYLIGGGVGIPPLVFLAQLLAAKGIATEVFLGGKSKEVVLCVAAFEELGLPVHIATDDGSQGFHGFIPELFRNTLGAQHPEKATLQVFCCGPTPMMQAVSTVVREYQLACQHSLEERMGCGLGVCIGCVTHTVDGYERVCREGPIFSDERLTWQA